MKSSLLSFFVIKVFIVFFLFHSCNDISTQYDLPENHGLSSEGLSKLGEYFNNKIKENKIPGAIVLIRKKNKIIFQNEYGYSNYHKKIKFKKDDIFRIASMTKLIANLAVLDLIEKGLISLEDPIEKYIPKFKNPTILETFNPLDSSYTSKKALNKISIKHLLTHTSGLTYGTSSVSYNDNSSDLAAIYTKAGIVELYSSKDIKMGENIDKLAILPLSFEPGTKYSYGMSTDVLGHLIEIISGQTLDIYLSNRFFTPLGMKDTYFYLPDSKADRLVPVQTNDNKIWSFYETDDYDIDFPIKGAKRYFSAGAGLSSTALDYSIFLQMILNNGIYNGISVLSPKIIDDIKIDQLPKNTTVYQKPLAYGLATGLITEDLIDRGEFGVPGTIYWEGHFATLFWVDPSNDLIVIILEQLLNNDWNSFRNDFKKIIYDSFIY